MYSRLPFNQYFSDTSHIGTMSIPDYTYDEITYIHKEHTHTAHYKVMYIENRNVIQIHFQGTAGLNQWIANFEFPEDYYDSFKWEGVEIQLRVHEGWGCMYQGMKHIIRDQYTALHKKYPDADLEIIGWSLGSAMAQLCAQDLCFNCGVRGHVFTYGSVKPFYGNDKNMKRYLSQCYTECWNFGDINDIVSYLVPLPRYFKLNKVKIAQDKFCITRIFKADKYHCEYWRPELYTKFEK